MNIIEKMKAWHCFSIGLAVLWVGSFLYSLVPATSWAVVPAAITFIYAFAGPMCVGIIKMCK